MEKKTLFKLFWLIVLLMARSPWAFSQNEHYLATRIKPGDICYLDEGGNERFISYRDWNRDNPPGELLGVVFFTYYGVRPPAMEGEKVWFGWMISIEESEECPWAPENSICYNTCIANYPVDGLSTPWNPSHIQKYISLADTCGWQNTYRILEYIYTGKGAVLSDATSPVLRYIFAEKNGVTDFSVKPTMGKKSWYLPSLGQIRMAYSMIGPVNKALAACGGTLLNTSVSWHSSTELDNSNNSVWAVNGRGICPYDNNAKKHIARNVRAVREF